jgi:hypothetical protein
MPKALAAVLAALIALPAAAAPKAESATECGIAADMAIVARSLAEEAIQRPQANSIMARIYDVSESRRGKELMGEILDAAYRNEGESSQKFAESLFVACMKSGGNMDTILGKKL